MLCSLSVCVSLFGREVGREFVGDLCYCYLFMYGCNFKM